jgi:predicted anti-sigma-YlaC factor YlaD
MNDIYVHDDAPYVLGVLDEDERVAFEAHLVDCADCRARVAELQGIPAVLAQVSLDELEQDVPETMLPGLLRRARRERRRRRLIVGTLSAVAAACLAALIVVAWPSSSSPHHAQQMTALANIPVAATVELHSTSWGTEITLDCRYTADVGAGYAYGLQVTDKSGHAYELGSWSLPSGEAIEYTSGTSLTTSQIAKVEIVTPSGTPVLRLVT